MNATLRFLSGQRTGQIVVLPPRTALVGGRDPDSALELPGANVSRRHIRLGWKDGSLVVENLSRTNALFVNGVRQSRSVLNRWDTLVVGPNVLRVESLPDDAVPGGTSEHPLMSALIEVQHLLAAGGSDLIGRSLEVLIDALPATRLAFITCGTAGGLQHGPVALRGPPPPGPPSLGFAKQVIGADHALLVETADVAQLAATLREQAVQTILGAPVRVDGQPVGVLVADNLQEPGRLNHTHLGGLEMLAQALEAVFQRDRLRQVERDHLRLEAETEAARKVQSHLYVTDPATLPGPWRWRACHRPALELCGDFWDCAATADGVRWLVADVSGKGLPAALLVSMLKIGFKSVVPRQPSPGKLLAELHRLVAGEIPPTMFFTAVALHVANDGALTYAAVGHPAPVLVGTTGSRLLPSGQGILGNRWLAPLPDALDDHAVPVTAGDRLILYTDGIVEADAGNGDQFGHARRQELMDGCRPLDLDAVMAAVMAGVDAHAHGYHQDDVALVLGELPGP